MTMQTNTAIQATTAAAANDATPLFSTVLVANRGEIA